MARSEGGGRGRRFKARRLIRPLYDETRNVRRGRIAGRATRDFAHHRPQARAIFNFYPAARHTFLYVGGDVYIYICIYIYIYIYRVYQKCGNPLIFRNIRI